MNGTPYFDTPKFIFFTYLPTLKISCVWREWLKSLKFGGPVLGISFSASKILVLKLGLHKSISKHPHYVQISALHVKWFWNYKRIDNFSSQILPIFLFFCDSIYDHMILGSPKLAHMTLLIILMLSLNFNFVGFSVC